MRDGRPTASAAKAAVTGAAAGAAVTYLFDPVAGRRRRARVRDEAVHLAHEGADAADVTRRDLENKATGLVAEAGRITGGGGPSRPDPRTRWSPAGRFLTGAAAGTAVAVGVVRGGAVGLVVAVAGAAVLVRSLGNRPIGELTGLGEQAAAIDVRKTITVHAPVDRVYDLWSHTERFPTFMSHVREVRPADEGQHWVIDGPAGSTVEFDADVTEAVLNRSLAWRSREGSTIAHEGHVRFEPEADDTTRVSVHLTYHPPAGAIGHGVATLLRSDPKTMLDDDLLRMKTLVETGHAPHDAARPEGHEG